MAAEAVRIDGNAWITRITVFWAICVVMVGMLDFFLYFLEWLPGEMLRRSFNIEKEKSLGTWISSSQSLLVGVTAGAVFARVYKRICFKTSLGWAIVALFFIYISFDDTAKFHERVGSAFRIKYEDWTGSALDGWFPSWGWQLFVAPFFVAMGIYILSFLWTAVAVRLRVWVVAGIGLLAVAVAIDFVEGMKYLDSDTEIHFMRLTEEMLEMFGTTAFLYVFLSTLNDHVTVYVADTSIESLSQH